MKKWAEPILIMERVPLQVLIVECDRVADNEIHNDFRDVGGVAFERQLRRVHTDDHKAVPAVF